MEGLDEESHAHSEMNSTNELHAAKEIHEDKMSAQHENEVEFLNKEEEHKYIDLQQVESSSESN